MRLLVALAAVLLAALAPAPSHAADDLSIAAFFGTFSGGGVAENRDSLYFAVTARDFDVTIRPEGKGFRVDWTSVIRRGGDPRHPDVRRNKATKVLIPTGTRGVYRGTESGDPLTGKELCWARLKKNTLSVFLMTVDRNGIYELQQYDRTLTPGGMRLTFKAWRDGDELRTVSGRLVKTGD
jgi:hypothetical protein